MRGRRRCRRRGRAARRPSRWRRETRRGSGWRAGRTDGRNTELSLRLAIFRYQNFDIEGNRRVERFSPAGPVAVTADTRAQPPLGFAHDAPDAMGRVRAGGPRLHRGRRGRDRAAHRDGDVAAVAPAGRLLQPALRRDRHLPHRVAGAAGAGDGGPRRQLAPVAARRRGGRLGVDDDPPAGPHGRARADRAGAGRREPHPDAGDAHPAGVGSVPHARCWTSSTTRPASSHR